MAEDFENEDAPDRSDEHESPIFRIKNRLRKNLQQSAILIASQLAQNWKGG